MSEENQQLAIQKVYLKDVSFESPNAPNVFSDGEWEPQVSVQLNTAHKAIAQDTYEVVLEITVTVKQKEVTAFLVELKQAGVFSLSGFSEEKLGGRLGAYCPGVLFPFAREAISELISKGGFPQLLLQPVNFRKLYAQQLEQQSASAEQDTAH